MFKILMDGNVMDSARVYGSAHRKAKQIKKLFCKKGVVTIEDARGNFVQQIGDDNVLES